MASSAPASSKALARADQSISTGILRLLTTPAAFFGSNWAAMLLIMTVIGVVPALSGATRVTTNLHQYADRAFTGVLHHARRTWWRDLPVSIGLWAVLALVIGDLLILSRMVDGGAQVFLVGITVPAIWVAVSCLSAYITTAAALEPSAARREVVHHTVLLLLSRPLRALIIPAVIIAVSPLWLLAPLTIAIGFSLPPFLVARVWGRPAAP